MMNNVIFFEVKRYKHFQLTVVSLIYKKKNDFPGNQSKLEISNPNKTTERRFHLESLMFDQSDVYNPEKTAREL